MHYLAHMYFLCLVYQYILGENIKKYLKMRVYYKAYLKSRSINDVKYLLHIH